MVEQRRIFFIATFCPDGVCSAKLPPRTRFMARRLVERQAVIRISPQIEDLLRLRCQVMKALGYADLDVTYRLWRVYLRYGR